MPTNWPNCVNRRSFDIPLIGRLGNAEVDDLGDRLAVLHHDQDVGRLDVAMNDAFLMRMLKGVTDGNEEFQALAGGEPILVAVLGDGDAVDVLHHEKGPPVIAGSGVKNVGDIGVVHQRQRLTFALEARQHLPAIHAQLDDFQCNLAANRVRLLGQVDRAHTPFADLAQKLIASEVVALDPGLAWLARSNT